MNEKMKRNRLNDAFKRFQRLPFLPTKGDARATATEKPTWQPMPFSLLSNCVPSNPNSAWQALAE
jgi:hypothetical protein